MGRQHTTRMSWIERQREVRGSRSGRDPGRLAGGTWVALRGLLLSLAIVVTLSSCLITQPTHFDEPPNSPPVLSDLEPAPMYPLNDLIRLITTSTTPSEAGVVPLTSIDLGVSVYDPDVDQTLQWRAYIDNNLFRGDDLGPSTTVTGRDRRTLTFPVSTAPLFDLATTGGCHRIDLFVSGGFSGSPTGHTPREAGDIASVTWWVASRADNTSPVDMTRCPRPQVTTP